MIFSLNGLCNAVLLAGIFNLGTSAVVEETLVAKYSRINADGTWLYRPLFNWTLPGPAIECNIGDTLKITVVNDMKKEELSVNWQAFIQTETNHMDGVPYITEYPISPDGGSRVYEFLAEKAGTFYYHSNQEFIKMSLHGIIIVRDPDEPLEYDEDLIAIQHADASSPTYPALVATDWYHKGPETLAAQLDNNIGVSLFKGAAEDFSTLTKMHLHICLLLSLHTPQLH